MMDFDVFADRFLAALYWETEYNHKQYVSAENLINKYSLQLKPTWISRMVDEWEHLYFKDVSKTLGGYSGWSFRISADGYRKVEATYRDDDEIAEFLGLDHSAQGVVSVANAPAANRIVKVSHNSDSFASAVEAVNNLTSQLETANDFGGLTEDEVFEARREISILEQSIAQESVRVDWIESLAKSCLQWIATKAAEQVVGSLALTALTALALLFGFSI